MAFRDKLVAEAAPYLEPGEQVQAVLAGQTVSPYWMVMSIWIVIFNDAYRAVVVTDRRILVFRTSRMRLTKFKRLEAVFDRRTLLGEPSGLNWPMTALGGKIYVNKRFHKDVRAADSLIPVSGMPGAAGAGYAPPPPPPPPRA